LQLPDCWQPELLVLAQWVLALVQQKFLLRAMGQVPEHSLLHCLYSLARQV
jgi:hypothetical protein